VPSCLAHLLLPVVCMTVRVFFLFLLVFTVFCKKLTVQLTLVKLSDYGCYCFTYNLLLERLYCRRTFCAFHWVSPTKVAAMLAGPFKRDDVDHAEVWAWRVTPVTSCAGVKVEVVLRWPSRPRPAALSGQARWSADSLQSVTCICLSTWPVIATGPYPTVLHGTADPPIVYPTSTPTTTTTTTTFSSTCTVPLFTALSATFSRTSTFATHRTYLTHRAQQRPVRSQAVFGRHVHLSTQRVTSEVCLQQLTQLCYHHQLVCTAVIAQLMTTHHCLWLIAILKVFHQCLCCL